MAYIIRSAEEEKLVWFAGKNLVESVINALCGIPHNASIAYCTTFFAKFGLGSREIGAPVSTLSKAVAQQYNIMLCYGSLLLKLSMAFIIVI